MLKRDPLLARSLSDPPHSFRDDSVPPQGPYQGWHGLEQRHLVLGAHRPGCPAPAGQVKATAVPEERHG